MSPEDPAWVDEIVRLALERAGSDAAQEAALAAQAQSPASGNVASTPTSQPEPPQPPLPEPPPPIDGVSVAEPTAPPTINVTAPPDSAALTPSVPLAEPADLTVTPTVPLDTAPSIPDAPRLPEPKDLVSAHPYTGLSASQSGLTDRGESPLYPDEDPEGALLETALGPAETDDAGAHRMRGFLEWGAVVVGALAVALLIKTFLMQAYFIPSGSMENTLNIGDRVLVNKLSYEFGDVGRGDLIVFERPPNQSGGEDDLIKRVIGLSGERLSIRDNTVFITLPDADAEQRLEEPYLEEGIGTHGFVDTSGCDDPSPASCTVPDGHVFVMGDNRGGSKDSRTFGPIDEDLIVGRAFLRVWPLGDISFL